MIDFLRKKLAIPEEKFFMDMADTGNTVSATIPIGLKKALDKGLIREGHKVVLCGFGVGYSWGATIIQI
jgi:3-oxoacyl-[acyl-carrier-protein] synthase-3